MKLIEHRFYETIGDARGFATHQGLKLINEIATKIYKVYEGDGESKLEDYVSSDEIAVMVCGDDCTIPTNQSAFESIYADWKNSIDLSPMSHDQLYLAILPKKAFEDASPEVQSWFAKRWTSGNSQAKISPKFKSMMRRG